MSSVALEDIERCSLCEALDRVLNKGAVVAGELMISVADIDLIYIALQLVVTSVETARRMRETPAQTAPRVAWRAEMEGVDECTRIAPD